MPRLPRIPDILTTANLSCGVASILLASQGQLTLACWLVFAGAFFDVLDGLAARALGGGTPLGTQLDSLADMVTFGVAPGVLAYMCTVVMYPLAFDELYVPPDWKQAGYEGIRYISLYERCLLLVIPLVITIASCWRLAKFNIDSRQSHGFLGLATPFNAMFWASLGLIAASSGFGMFGTPALVQELVLVFFSGWGLVAGAALCLGALMLSELPLPSLKFKHMRWRDNEVIYLLLGIGLVLVLLYGILAVPLILLLYLLSPLWGKLFPKTA